jgi:hypothetical protein
MVSTRTDKLRIDFLDLAEFLDSGLRFSESVTYCEEDAMDSRYE